MDIKFKVEAWSALAPGLESKGDWQQWLSDPSSIDGASGKITLKEIPALLRRRFNPLGKCVMGSVLQILKKTDKTPVVFASRHGDTELTLSLLEGMGKGDDMSPTHFSLAVHNAVSGLYTIARKDTSAVTAIAAMGGLTINALFEAVGQLQDSRRVLCVIYDAPLPALYSPYCFSEPFPYAIAVMLNNEKGESYTIKQIEMDESIDNSAESSSELSPFLSLLTGLSTNMKTQSKVGGFLIEREQG